MGLDIIDGFFIACIIIAVIAGIFLMRKSQLDFFHSIIFGIFIGGSVITWGVVKSDFASIPIWIQAGATLALLSITMMSTYATMVTAQANRELAEATQNHLLQNTKDRQSKIIKEVAQQVFHPILSLFDNELMAIESGSISVLHSYKKLQPESKLCFDLNPRMYFIKQIYAPDTFLRSRSNNIASLNTGYDAYAKKRDLLLEKIYTKKMNFLEQFGKYCLELKKDDDIFIIPQDIDIIFCQVLANSYLKRYTGDDFVNIHRQSLIKLLNENGFTDEIMEYAKIKTEFLEIKDEYISLINGLFDDWQREYLLTESEIRGSSSSQFI